MDGVTVAQFGQIHPEIAAGRQVAAGRMDCGALPGSSLQARVCAKPRYQALPRYPAVERDFSFVFEDAVSFEKIQKAVAGLRIAELREFVPVEIFRGGPVPAGKYSILLRATFQSHERTLREEEVAQWSGLVIQVLEALGGKLRK